jgi:mRNA-degrading endonuclease YafQ of YafQ-DinJ toxin-antitoxin module
LPTYSRTDQFDRDWDRLNTEERAAFKRAVKKFIEDLEAGGSFRASLRVKPMQKWSDVFEMTWEGEDGRATFQYGEEIIDGEKHIIWRRIGGHSIFGSP